MIEALIDNLILKEDPLPGNMTPGQMAYLDSFDAGMRLVVNRLRDKLFYIPEEWKRDGNTLALFNIVNNTLLDIESMIDHHRQEVKDYG